MRFSVDLLFSVIIKVLLVGRIQGAARFTLAPPSILYVSVGETAKLVWDYNVDNRREEFGVFSPRWVFYDDNDKPITIAQESKLKNWKWYINRGTCPARLLNPVRVSKESTATLVINNVTLADSGTYGCVLYLASGSPITSKVKLVVTSLSHITLNPPSTYITVIETQILVINCSADGTPSPNVTWHEVQGYVIDKGLRKATVNIKNITRYDSGIYNCCATNNPNKAAICKSTLVSVQYKPKVVNSTASSNNGNKVILRCMASGIPSPRITWYDPSNRSVTTELRNVNGGSLIAIDKGIYGLYKCKAQNILGHDENFIKVTKTDFPSLKVTSISTAGIINPTSKFKQDPSSKSTDASLISQSINVVFSTPKVHQGKSSSPVGNKEYTIFLAAGGTLSFVLLATIIILTVLIFRKHEKSKAEAKGNQGENEVSSMPLEAAEHPMPIYADVDLSKKKRNRQQKKLEDIPIYAQVDKTKKKHPTQIIYAELDHIHSNADISSAIPPPLPENDCIQNKSQTDKAEPIYACIVLE